MANRTVSIFIRFSENGIRRAVAAAYAGNARLKQGIGTPKGKEVACRGGIYWIRWNEGRVQKTKRIGSDPTDALKAQMRQEAVLAGDRVPIQKDNPAVRTILASALRVFLLERSTHTDERSLARWRWELELFIKVCGKTYLHEIDRADCFAYMRWYQDRKKKPRTVYNRMVSLGVFLRAAKHTVEFVFSQRKDRGEIPDYAEKTVDRYTSLDLKKLFAACDSETRLRYLFFLDTGSREREVMFACREDFFFEPEDSEFASTYEVRPRDDLGFKTKKGKTCAVPLTPRLSRHGSILLKTAAWFLRTAMAAPRGTSSIN